MIESIITNAVTAFINSAAQDAVAVFNQNFDQVFRRARPAKVTVKPDSKTMDQPIETGTMITDHRILNPLEIELSLIIRSEDFRDVYLEIQQLYQNSTLLIVQTKAATFDNQVIASMPHDEDPSLFDTITLALRFKQILFANTQTTFAPANKTKKSTVDRGNQQANPATPEQTEKAGSWAGSWNVFGNKK